MGTITPANRRFFWRKCTPEGVPLYLQVLLKKLSTISRFDKVLVLSFIRCYRHIEGPVKADVSTIIEPPKSGVNNNVQKFLLDLSMVYPRIGYGFKLKTVDRDNPLLDHSILFTPGVATLSGWVASGALGKGVSRILLEIARISSKS